MNLDRRRSVQCWRGGNVNSKCDICFVIEKNLNVYSTPPDNIRACKRKMYDIFIVLIVKRVKIALGCHVAT